MDLHFCSRHLLRIQTHVCSFQVCKLQLVVLVTEPESGPYMCDLSLLHASDSSYQVVFYAWESSPQPLQRLPPLGQAPT